MLNKYLNEIDLVQKQFVRSERKKKNIQFIFENLILLQIISDQHESVMYSEVCLARLADYYYSSNNVDRFVFDVDHKEYH